MHFTHLPDSARLWAFGVEPAPDAEAAARVLDEVDAFLDGWKAHGQDLSAASEWLHGRFLLVAVDEDVTPPSGCSIDALVHRLKGLEEELGLSIVGGAPIWYRTGPDAGSEIRRVPRPDFRDLAASGEVAAETVVFDLSITRLGDLRGGGWETTAGQSWHRRYLP